MKILEINKYHYIRGGSERYVFELSKILKMNGHDVIHFSMQHPDNQESGQTEYFIDDVPLDKFKLKNIFKFFYNYDAVRKLKALIDNERPDIAHLHNINHQLSPAIIKVLKKNEIPVVQTLHDYKLICPNTRLFTKNEICNRCQGGKYYNCFINACMHDSYAKSFLGSIEMYLNKSILKYYDLVDLFIAPSRFMKEICVKFGVPETKIMVLNNFIDVPVKKSSTRAPKDYFLYFGRLNPEKGIDTVIRSMAISKNEHNLKIAGTGPQIYELMALAEDLGVAGRVEFLGQQRGKNLETLINNARAVIIPSRWPENMPYALLEAMAVGKTIIASDQGGLPELIEKNKNGFIFPAGDASALSEIMDGMDDKIIKAVGAKAKSSIRKLNSGLHYEALIKAFNSLK